VKTALPLALALSRAPVRTWNSLVSEDGLQAKVSFAYFLPNYESVIAIRAKPKALQKLSLAPAMRSPESSSSTGA